MKSSARCSTSATATPAGSCEPVQSQSWQRRTLKCACVDGKANINEMTAPISIVKYVAAKSRPMRLPSTMSQTTKVIIIRTPPVQDQ